MPEDGAQDAPEDAPADAVSGGAIDSTAPLIVVADDIADVRSLMRAQLERNGWRVHEAADGRQAIEACWELVPDLILLDIDMPEVDGLAVLRTIKDDERLSGIPAVVITGAMTAQDTAGMLEAGAHDVLRKPFDRAELVARVRASLRVKRLQDELGRRTAELGELIRTDPLTGLSNRRDLGDHLSRLASAARRRRQPFSVVIVDVDGLRRVNRDLGRTAGDEVIAEVARRIEAQLRGEDVAGRLAGEEFLLILPDTDLDGAWKLGERVRSAVAEQPVTAGASSHVVTVSVGCADGDGDDPDEQVRRAEAALDQAKDTGRNRTVAVPRPG